MFKPTIPVSMMTFSVGYNPNKVKFSFAKTKEKLSQLFEAHQNAFEKVKDDKETSIMNVPQSFINTAYSIVQIFISEFQKGKVKNGVMRITKSYIQGHMVGSKLSIRTIDRHINRLMNHLALPFISMKFRSTLGENTGPVNVNTNCIALVLDKSVLACESPQHQQLFEECYNSKPPREKPHPLAFLDDLSGDLPMMKTNKQRETEVFLQKPKDMGSVMAEMAKSGGLFQNFGNQFTD